MTIPEYQQMFEAYQQVHQFEGILRDLQEGDLKIFVADEGLRETYYKSIKAQKETLEQTYSVERMEQAINLYHRIRELKNGLEAIRASSAVWVEGNMNPFQRIDLAKFPEANVVMQNMLAEELDHLQTLFAEL